MRRAGAGFCPARTVHRDSNLWNNCLLVTPVRRCQPITQFKGNEAMDTNKTKALSAALSEIELQCGKGSVMRMGDAGAVKDVEAISTGSLSRDIALGIGGLPRGRVVEIYGPESSGKTTLTLQVIAEAQKLGGTAAFVDDEHALDPNYARKLGVNVDDLLVSQPDTGEQALEIADMLVRSGAVDVVVVDSVAALTPKAEIDGEMGDSHVGLQARLMSQALRKLTANIKRSNTQEIFINQIRMKIRVMVVKIKVAPPFKQAEFEILYGEGISREGEIVDLGVQAGLVDKSGAWYSYNGTRIGQGKDNARTYLKEHPAVAREIEDQIRAKSLTLRPAGTEQSEEPAEAELD